MTADELSELLLLVVNRQTSTLTATMTKDGALVIEHESGDRFFVTVKEADGVTIPLSVYLGLLESEKKLSALEAAGVDNWEGYEETMRLLEDI